MSILDLPPEDRPAEMAKSLREDALEEIDGIFITFHVALNGFILRAIDTKYVDINLSYNMFDYRLPIEVGVNINKLIKELRDKREKCQST